MDKHVSLEISQQLLIDIVEHLMTLPDHMSKDILNFALAKAQSRSISFEEGLANIRKHLSQIYERGEDWHEAASILANIPLETGQK